MHRKKRAALGSLALLAATLFLACGDSPTRPETVPEDHTVEKDGAFHAPGLNNPEATCTICHGADLMGGANGEPSCFACHGQEWS